jgi:hypothetical protein
LDRSLFPKIVSALNPGGLFLCKMPVHWGSDIALARANLKFLYQDEIVSSFPACRLSITTNGQSEIGE